MSLFLNVGALKKKDYIDKRVLTTMMMIVKLISNILFQVSVLFFLFFCFVCSSLISVTVTVCKPERSFITLTKMKMCLHDSSRHRRPSLSPKILWRNVSPEAVSSKTTWVLTFSYTFCNSSQHVAHFILKETFIFLLPVTLCYLWFERNKIRPRFDEIQHLLKSRWSLRARLQ